MAIEVRVPSIGQVLSFPDDTPDNVIDSTVQDLLAGQPTQQKLPPLEVPPGGAQPAPIPEIVQPPKTSELQRFLQSAATGSRPFLEAGGAVGGGLLGAPLGPPGVVGGGAGGFTLGAEVADVLEQFAGVRQPRGLGTELKEAGGRFGVGLLAESGGVAAPALVRQLGKPLARRGAQIRAAEETFERAGVTPTPGEVLGRPPVRQVELDVAERELLNKFGALEDTPTTAGGKFIERVALRRKAAKNRVDRLYEALNEVVPENTAVGLGETKKTAAELLEQAETLKKFNIRPATQKLLDGVLREQDIVWRDMDELRRFVGQEIGTLEKKARRAALNSTEARRLGAFKKLFGSIEKDITSNSERLGGDIAERSRLARGFFGRQADRFSNKEIKKLIESDPGKIVDTVFKRNNLQALKKVKAAGGVSGFNALKGQFADKIVSSSKASNAIKRFDADTLEFVFTRDELKDLRALAKIADSKIPDKRGSVLSALAQTPVVGPVIRALVEKSGDKAFSVLWNSKGARKLLIRGLELPADSAQGAALAARLSILLDRDDEAIQKRMERIVPQAL